MEEISQERITAILICLYYGSNTEIVETMQKLPDYYTLDYAMYFTRNGIRNEFILEKQEVDMLLRVDIIELDGGCEEPDFEFRVFVCTDQARDRMNEIIKKYSLPVGL